MMLKLNLVTPDIVCVCVVCKVTHEFIRYFAEFIFIYLAFCINPISFQYCAILLVYTGLLSYVCTLLVYISFVINVCMYILLVYTGSLSYVFTLLVYILFAVSVCILLVRTVWLYQYMRLYL